LIGDFVAVGRIVKAHGVHGEVAVEILTEYPDRRFTPGARLVRDGGAVLTVAAARRHHDRMLVRFEEFADRTAAEVLRGELVYVPESELPPLPDGSYWPHQLIGCSVVTEDGEEIGVVSEVLSGPANDVWVTEGESRSIMIPAISDVIAGVDVEARRIDIRRVPGLLDEE
jgi:16S rRNA processing protein RimM